MFQYIHVSEFIFFLKSRVKVSFNTVTLYSECELEFAIQI